MSQPPHDPYAQDPRPGEAYDPYAQDARPGEAYDPYAQGSVPPAQPGYEAQGPTGQGAFGQQAGPRSGGLFPFPHRTWQTSRGSTVTVGGCCLPLPLGCLTTVAAAGTVLAVKAIQARR